ncbi:DUF551 domain-containing protein [Acinetobacter sp. ANC 3781]
MDIKEEHNEFFHELDGRGFIFQNKNWLGGCFEDDQLQVVWEMWQAAKAQAVPEWIDASDRLPEEGEEVLVHHYGHIVQATRDKKYSGGFKQRNCYGWESVSCYVSHWMLMSVKLPESVHFYYEHDAKVAKEKAMIEAQEQKG